MRSSRYVWAVVKNHSLLHKALMLRDTIVGMDTVDRRKVFTRVIYEAVRENFLSSIIKVFEDRAQVASFWYLIRVDELPMRAYQELNPFDIQNVSIVSEKLKIIRDRAHFHLDRDHTTNDAYEAAQMPWELFYETVEFAYGFLTYLRTNDLGLTGLTDWNYSPTDAQLAAAAIEQSETRSAF